MYRRYAVGTGLRYTLYRDSTVLEQGSGVTRDFSAGGILFRADRSLPVGLEVELRINWPAKVDDGSSLCVTVTGQIVRSAENEVAVKIASSEFRTSHSSAAS